jgi:hypothetical protein
MISYRRTPAGSPPSTVPADGLAYRIRSSSSTIRMTSEVFSTSVRK